MPSSTYREQGGVSYARLAEGDREAAWPGVVGAGLLGSTWTTVRERSDLPGARGPAGGESATTRGGRGRGSYGPNDDGRRGAQTHKNGTRVL